MQDLGGMHDLSLGFAYNPASEIVTTTRSNDVYAWTGNVNGARQDSANGLNQLASIGGTATAHDARGNMTSDGTRSYSYTSENLLASSGGTTLGYDPLMRLERVSGHATVRFGYDGSALIAERDGAGALMRRWVHGPGTDEPLVEYEGAGTGNRRWLHADERGSIIALTDGSSGAIAVNRYDEYGVPGSSNSGRFQYTGQVWLPEVGLYHYKARMYNPGDGRFMQTDPIGYGDGMNLYAYVGADPVNGRDPTGLFEICWEVYIPGQNYAGGRSTNENTSTDENEGVVHGGKYDKRCVDLFDPMRGIAIPMEPHLGTGPNGGGQVQSPCSAPLGGRAHKGETVNSRRRQVRRELRGDILAGAVAAGLPGAVGAYAANVARNVARLTPNYGSWIRGGTPRDHGNLLYGAVTGELGISLPQALRFADLTERADDAWDRFVGNPPDETTGGDSEAARPRTY